MNLSLNAITAATQDQIRALLNIDDLTTLMGFETEGVNAILFRIFYAGNVTPERVALAEAVLAECGVAVPPTVTIQSVLDAMGAMWPLYQPTEAAYYERQAFAAAVALKAGQPDAALTILDGPEGAGIGWALTEEDLKASLAA
ncbi:hypothetical protein EKD04_017270 [Chloroflexales bacterium ZM16-3]|nr:hypothetical protein [Chloroflexales bacterium ZM16-3]